MPKFLTKWKVIDGIAVIAIVALLGYWFASPYFTVRSLRTAIVTADEQALDGIVDFQVLRQNLKDQLSSEMVRWAVEERNEPSAIAMSAFSELFVEKLIDAYVTPSGVAGLASKVEINEDANVPFTALFDSVGSGFLEQGEFAIDRGLTSFSLLIKTRDGSGDEIEVVFEGNGLKWTLVNVILPLNNQG